MARTDCYYFEGAKCEARCNHTDDIGCNPDCRVVRNYEAYCLLGDRPFDCPRCGTKNIFSCDGCGDYKKDTNND